MRYKLDGRYKSYVKKGFLTRKDAVIHEAEMRQKLSLGYVPPKAEKSSQSLETYLDDWVERHGETNLRPSTLISYRSIIRNHINPLIGQVPLNRVTPELLDDLFARLLAEGLSDSSVRYVKRILSVALEHARKYHYIDTNPAKDTITRLGRQGKTPDPYTIEQMRQLLGAVSWTQWELLIVLAGLYGLRLSEAIGLRWRHVDLERGVFSVVEQLPCTLPTGGTTVTAMAPLKSSERTLPITEPVRPYFARQLAWQAQQKQLLAGSGQPYYENDLVLPKPNGAPRRRDRVSADFARLLRRLGLAHIRFHDLRHSAATNMYQLTGDFYAVGQILGHSLKGAGLQLGLGSSLDAVTAQYIDVRLDRKKLVLEAYHHAVLGVE